MTDLKCFPSLWCLRISMGCSNAFPDDKLFAQGRREQSYDLGEARQSLRENVQS